MQRAAAAPVRIVMRRGRSAIGDVAGIVLRSVRPGLRVRQRALARRQGVRQPAFVLTFDCDTDEDVAVVDDVHRRLRALGIQPSYAVPGSLLEAGATTYTRIAESGAEILNHGYARHCTYDPVARTYESSYFYDQLSWSDVEVDVVGGHEAHIRVLGRAPVGFRVPHFGTFQRRDRLRRLHRLLASLGYAYSSSTMPLAGIIRGPVHAGHGVLELPVTGRPSAPNRVLDTWSFRFAPGRRVGEADYERELRIAIEELLDGRAQVVNVYADPSQVADWPGFFECVARAAPVALPSLSALAGLR